MMTQSKFNFLKTVYALTGISILTTFMHSSTAHAWMGWADCSSFSKKEEIERTCRYRAEAFIKRENQNETVLQYRIRTDGFFGIEEDADLMYGKVLRMDYYSHCLQSGMTHIELCRKRKGAFSWEQYAEKLEKELAGKCGAVEFQKEGDSSKILKWQN